MCLDCLIFAISVAIAAGTAPTGVIIQWYD